MVHYERLCKYYNLVGNMPPFTCVFDLTNNTLNWMFELAMRLDFMKKQAD